jgi:DNA repair exonuclease SbcCD ATPase subunit
VLNGTFEQATGSWIEQLLALNVKVVLYDLPARDAGGPVQAGDQGLLLKARQQQLQLKQATFAARQEQLRQRGAQAQHQQVRTLRRENADLNSMLSDLQEALSTSQANLAKVKQEKADLQEQLERESIAYDELVEEIERVRHIRCPPVSGKTHPSEQPCQQQRRKYDQALEVRQQEVQRLTNQLRQKELKIQDLSRDHDEQQLYIDEIDLKNEQMRLNLQKFNRLKELIRSEELTERQQQEFTDILQSLKT